jgi:hypothetical protein
MYDRPMLTVRLDGSLHCLREEAEFRAFFEAAPDEIVRQFRQTYNVRTTSGGWKIYASTQHVE